MLRRQGAPQRRRAGRRSDCAACTEPPACEGSRHLKYLRDVAAGLLLTAAAAGSVATSASAQLPPGVDAMAGAAAKSRTSTIAAPRLYTKDSRTLLLAFVVAGGTAAGERVERITGDGLHWSPVARSDGRTGAVEIWRARAKHWLKGRIVARLAAAAYPASIRLVAYGGASTFLSAHAASQGRASTPGIRLRPVSGSLVLAAGLGEGQRVASLLSSDSSRRVLSRSFDARAKTGIWLQLTAARTAHLARAAGAGWSRNWHMAAVDVVVPSLKRLIEEGLLTAFGAKRRPVSATNLPPGCPALPAFEVGVQDD